MLCSIYETKSNPPKNDVTLKLRTEECRLCTTKNDKKAFVVQEVIFHTYYTCFYVSHLKHGEFSSWKKVPLIFTYWVVSYMPCQFDKFNNNIKKKSRNTIKTGLCCQLMWQPWSDLTQCMMRPNLCVTAVRIITRMQLKNHMYFYDFTNAASLWLGEVPKPSTINNITLLGHFKRQNWSGKV